jgi:hypothetical protein
VETYTDQDLLADLLSSDPVLPERQGGITVREYAHARHISNTVASEKLLTLYRDGKLTRQYCQVNGQRMLVYYKA